MPSWGIAIMIVGWPVAFVAMFVGITFLIGTLTHWRELAREYPAPIDAPTGESFPRGSLIVGGARFGRAVTYTITPDGLDARVGHLFALAGNRPWRIPWSNVRALGEHGDRPPRRWEQLLQVEITVARRTFRAWLPQRVVQAFPNR